MQRSRREAIAMRHARVRKKITGTTEKPRLCFFRSLRYLYCQVVDDATGRTLASASTMEKAFEQSGSNPKRLHAKATDDAVRLGHAIAERSKEKGITHVVFDRGGFQYHGRVKAFADAAREKGLEF